MCKTFSNITSGPTLVPFSTKSISSKIHIKHYIWGKSWTGAKNSQSDLPCRSLTIDTGVLADVFCWLDPCLLLNDISLTLEIYRSYILMHDFSCSCFEVIPWPTIHLSSLWWVVELPNKITMKTTRMLDRWLLGLRHPRNMPLLRHNSINSIINSNNNNINSNQVKESQGQERLEVSRQWLVRLPGSSKQVELQYWRRVRWVLIQFVSCVSYLLLRDVDWWCSCSSESDWEFLPLVIFVLIKAVTEKGLSWTIASDWESRADPLKLRV